MTIILCGNKIDREEERVVTTDEGRQFAQHNDLLFLETSAKNGTNVHRAFMESSERIL
jgi:GTPase SAR1 family protein